MFASTTSTWHFTVPFADESPGWIWNATSPPPAPWNDNVPNTSSSLFLGDINISQILGNLSHNLLTNSIELSQFRTLSVKVLMPLLSVLEIGVCLWLFIQIYRHIELQTPVNKLMASFCITGCIMGTLGLFFAWVGEVGSLPELCLGILCMYSSMFVASFLHFMVISFERYAYIVHPFIHIRILHSSRHGGKTIFLVLFAVWSSSLTIAFTPFYVPIRSNWRALCFSMTFVITPLHHSIMFGGILITSTTAAAIVYFHIFRVATRQLREMTKKANLRANEIKTVLKSLNESPINLREENRGGAQAKRVNPEGMGKDFPEERAGKNLNQQRQLYRGKHDQILLRRHVTRKARSKIRSAFPFMILYAYYVMSWAPNTVLKACMAFTNNLDLGLAVWSAEIVTMLSPIGHCLLYMYLENDIWKVTLGQLGRFLECKRQNRQ